MRRLVTASVIAILWAGSAAAQDDVELRRIFEQILQDPGNPGLVYEYRYYFEAVADSTKNRRDHVIAPGAQLIVGGLVGNRADLIFSCGFEHRGSNDRSQLYDNHTVGAKVLWRF